MEILKRNGGGEGGCVEAEVGAVEPCLLGAAARPGRDNTRGVPAGSFQTLAEAVGPLSGPTHLQEPSLFPCQGNVPPVPSFNFPRVVFFFNPFPWPGALPTVDISTGQSAGIKSPHSASGPIRVRGQEITASWPKRASARPKICFIASTAWWRHDRKPGAQHSVHRLWEWTPQKKDLWG